ncbi:MAG: hypothetical protein P4N41_16550 [Negativicutes bacterium]|nr:hypothetical protein [Negativicutes bacterium]
MICTVLVIWFAAVAVAGIVIGSYDYESARAIIIGIVAGTGIFLLAKGRPFNLELEIDDSSLMDWPEKKDQYRKQFAKKA